MIIFTPAELRSLAAKCRAEAAKIEKGPISIFAADAVFDENSQAARYERDADEFDAIELRATSFSQMETVCDLLMEFGTPLQKDKHRAASLLSRVAQEANVEAGFQISSTDTAKALKAALGNGGSTWHGLVRKKLHERFRSNEV